MDLIIELSGMPEFVALAPVSKTASDEREREELVARFFAYSDGLSGYKDRPSEFIFNYVKRMNFQVVDEPALINRYRAQFAAMIDFVERVFPFGFRRNQKGKATPRARFEAIAIGSRLAMIERPLLATEAVDDVLPWLTSDDFTRVTGSDGANAIARLRERTGFVRDKLLST